ncbi:hypothetical protein OH76DRAFT_1356574, partial [Lentinus brumalis]
PAPINLDCWPAFRDKDEDTEVVFAVYNSVLPRQTPRDLHWSLAWAIRGTDPAAWRQIHRVETEAGTWDSRYVYWGPLTKTSGPTDDVARRYSLGAFSLEHHMRIDELAGLAPVMVPDGTWNCQDWLLDLFERMVAAGLTSGGKRDEVLAAAGYESGKSSSLSELWKADCGPPSVKIRTCISRRNYKISQGRHVLIA